MDKNLIFSKNFLFLASQLLFGTYKKVLTTLDSHVQRSYQRLFGTYKKVLTTLFQQITACGEKLFGTYKKVLTTFRHRECLSHTWVVWYLQKGTYNIILEV